MLSAEIHLREVGRQLEHLAVAEPEVDREARIVLLVAQRIRARWLKAAA